MKNIYYLAIIALIFLSSCANHIEKMGANFNLKPEKDLTIGSTMESDLLKLLKQPQSHEIVQKNVLRSNVYFYYYYDKIPMRKQLLVEFIDGVLNGYIYYTRVKNSNIPGFSDKQQQNIKVGPTNADDVMKLMGFPNGVIRLPSNIRFSNIEQYYLYLELDNIPESTKEIWIYIYNYSNQKGYKITKDDRYLFLFFDNKNDLILKTFDDIIERKW